MRGEFELVDDCVQFDFKTQQFSAFACPKAARLSGQLSALGDKLYWSGGSSKTATGLQSDRSIEAFDPTTASWQTVLAELPFDTRHTRTLSYGPHLLMVSTQQSDATIRIALVTPDAAH